MAIAENEIPVEVACALPERQVVVALTVPVGTTAGEAVRRADMQARFPELDVAKARIGVFGRLCSPDRELVAGDRVEIYRPLLADPKEVRRKRAAKGETMGTAGGNAKER